MKWPHEVKLASLMHVGYLLKIAPEWNASSRPVLPVNFSQLVLHESSVRSSVSTRQLMKPMMDMNFKITCLVEYCRNIRIRPCTLVRHHRTSGCNQWSSSTEWNFRHHHCNYIYSNLHTVAMNGFSEVHHICRVDTSLLHSAVISAPCDGRLK